jgi:hypothetical protein
MMHGLTNLKFTKYVDDGGDHVVVMVLIMVLVLCCW